MKEKKKTAVKTTKKKIVATSPSAQANTKCAEMTCSKYYGIMRCILNTPYNWSIIKHS